MVTTTVRTSTTVTGSGTVTTPTAFYLKSSDGHYVSLAKLTGGAFYLNLSSSAGADTFSLNSANQLIVATSGSQYKGYITVGTPAGYDVADDWFPIEATKSGADSNRPALCCGMTAAKLLTCGNGEIFADCWKSGLFEGPAAAVTADYYYSAYQCSSVTLSVVTS